MGQIKEDLWYSMFWFEHNRPKSYSADLVNLTVPNMYNEALKPEAQFKNKPMMSPIELIERLGDIYGEYPPMSGGCLKFHLLLKKMYPQAEGFYNGEHFVTFIDGDMYDQKGIILGADFIEEGYRHISEKEMPYIVKTFRDVSSKFIEEGYGKN